MDIMILTRYVNRNSAGNGWYYSYSVANFDTIIITSSRICYANYKICRNDVNGPTFTHAKATERKDLELYGEPITDVISIILAGINSQRIVGK